MPLHPFVLCNRLSKLCVGKIQVKTYYKTYPLWKENSIGFIRRIGTTTIVAKQHDMMTLTSALDFAKDGSVMNAVDTGWVTDEDPIELFKVKEEIHDFQTPLDYCLIGAARSIGSLIGRIKHW